MGVPDEYERVGSGSAYFDCGGGGAIGDGGADGGERVHAHAVRQRGSAGVRYCAECSLYETPSGGLTRPTKFGSVFFAGHGIPDPAHIKHEAGDWAFAVDFLGPGQRLSLVAA